MSLILHISDLHLSPPDEDQLPDDYKWDLVPVNERASQKGMLRNTLTQLGQQLVTNKSILDAIVISGDITVANREDGFKEFEQVLSWLGAARPENSRIVVVPGNHDVEWGAKDSVAHYHHFVKYIRDRGFITPFLEGIDLIADEPPTNFEKRFLLDSNANWAIVPINSSHYCGSLEPLDGIPDPLWSRIPDLLVGVGAKRNEAEKSLRHLRMQDVARISPWQLSAIRETVSKVSGEAKAKGGQPLFIGVLHHQLLPVSIREEFKPFETITNLGHLRYALRDNGFCAVLHGHKHTEYAYYDYIHRLPEPDIRSPHRLLVVSANAAKLKGAGRDVVARLIDIPATRHHPHIAITNVPAVEAATTLVLPESTYYPVWQQMLKDPAVPDFQEIAEGSSVDEVYERALSVFCGLSPNTTIPNFTCRVWNPQNPAKLPAVYPSIPGVDDRSKWFTTLVDWWQKKDFKRLSGDHHFNHGHRIYSYAHKVDQIAKVVGVIRNSPLTSRALVSLFRPDVDDVDSDAQFPSFCFVQFVVREVGSECSLEVVAYFRKQEIKYWWPVNIAELCRLQAEVFDQVKGEVEAKCRKALLIGPITTIAAIAAAGETIPKILVPALDFDLEQDSQKLWDMTYALCSADIRSKGDYVNVWKTVLATLVPPEKQNPSGVPVPVQSVEYLADISVHFAAHHDDGLRQLSRCWSELAFINAHHARAMNERKLSSEEHRNWRAEVLAKLNEIRKIVNASLATNLPELV